MQEHRQGSGHSHTCLGIVVAQGVGVCADTQSEQFQNRQVNKVVTAAEGHLQLV